MLNTLIICYNVHRVSLAVGGIDFRETNLVLSFHACLNRSCVNVPIADDMVDEGEEFFTYSLIMTNPDPRFTLNPASGLVSILGSAGMYSAIVRGNQNILQDML